MTYVNDSKSYVRQVLEQIIQSLDQECVQLTLEETKAINQTVEQSFRLKVDLLLVISKVAKQLRNLIRKRIDRTTNHKQEFLRRLRSIVLFRGRQIQQQAVEQWYRRIAANLHAFESAASDDRFLIQQLSRDKEAFEAWMQKNNVDIITQILLWKIINNTDSLPDNLLARMADLKKKFPFLVEQLNLIFMLPCAGQIK